MERCNKGEIVVRPKEGRNADSEMVDAIELCLDERSEKAESL